jgi:hypothetical protein
VNRTAKKTPKRKKLTRAAIHKMRGSLKETGALKALMEMRKRERAL